MLKKKVCFSQTLNFRRNFLFHSDLSEVINQAQQLFVEASVHTDTDLRSHLIHLNATALTQWGCQRQSNTCKHC